MQRNMSGILGLLVFAVALAVPTVQAQSRFVATVPFDFTLGQAAMPAGIYEVGQMSDQVAVIRNSTNGVAQLLIKSGHVQSLKVQRAKLVFNKYGNEYFLCEIWDGNSNIGIHLPKSPREKEISLAANRISDPAAIVIVAMN
jgi:hypothetical protein